MDVRQGYHFFERKRRRLHQFNSSSVLQLHCDCMLKGSFKLSGFFYFQLLFGIGFINHGTVIVAV